MVRRITRKQEFELGNRLKSNFSDTGDPGAAQPGKILHRWSSTEIGEESLSYIFLIDRQLRMFDYRVERLRPIRISSIEINKDYLH